MPDERRQLICDLCKKPILPGERRQGFWATDDGGFTDYDKGGVIHYQHIVDLYRHHG